MFNHENLKGKVAVVTGGGGVLCAAFAKTLAAQGCKVAVLDLNEGAAQNAQMKSTQTAERLLQSAVMFLNLNLWRMLARLLMKSSVHAIFF